MLLVSKNFLQQARLYNYSVADHIPLVTVPREIARWKHISKGTLLRWSDGGENRIIVEVLKD